MSTLPATDLAMVGASFRTLEMQALGRLLLPKEGLKTLLPRLAESLGALELVYLATCNRLEILVRMRAGTDAAPLRARLFEFLAGRPPAPREAEQAFRVWPGVAAIEHLLMVACGLDSARVGDRQIPGQLRDAWLLARSAGVAGSAIDELVSAALAASREANAVRARLAPDESGGLADRAVRRVLEHVGASDAPVALIGVSPMTRACGNALRRHGTATVVINRTAARAAELAAELHTQAFSLAAFRRSRLRVGAIIAAVGAAEFVLSRSELRRHRAEGESPLVVDLGVPANIEPAAAAAAGFAYFGMDDLIGEVAATRSASLVHHGPVRAVVDRNLDNVLRATVTRVAGPLLGALHQRYEAELDYELTRMLDGELAALDESGRAALRRWTGLLAHRMAHVPLNGLRSLAAGGDLRGVEICLDAMSRALEGQRPVEAGGAETRSTALA
jgi:glutamyl-tRNA reductase